MIIYENKSKFWRPCLLMENRKEWTPPGSLIKNWDRRGDYYGLIYVRIHQMLRPKSSKISVTTLQCTYNGFKYQRNYQGVHYSERGLSLLCARFIKDVMKGRIK